MAGTFSKTMGSVGSFIAASEELIELLHFYSRTYMFSADMTPQAAGSSIAAMEVIEDESQLREQLWMNTILFKFSPIKNYLQI